MLRGQHRYCEGSGALLGGLYDGRDAACWSMRAATAAGQPSASVRLVGIDNSTYVRRDSSSWIQTQD
eukprot:COSAG01_NODE_41251_length_453_cov_43.644068_1_plen_67_part_00